MSQAVIAGVILAGGRGRRMGGQNKALMPLAGRPLLQHVMDRVQPQVRDVVLSVESSSPALERFGLPQIADAVPGNSGPLCGLLSALLNLNSNVDWLLLVPCDAPFLPVNLASRLLKSAQKASRPGAMVRYRSELQPTFSIWNRCLCTQLQKAVVEDGFAGFKQFLQIIELAELDWPEADRNPFFNINDPKSLQAARLIMESSTGEDT